MKQQTRLVSLCSVALTGFAMGGAVKTAHANGGHFLVDDAAITPPSTCSVETWATRLDSSTQFTLNPMCNFTGGSEWALPVEYDSELDEITTIGLDYNTVLYSRGSGPAVAVGGGVRYDRVTSEMNEIYLNIPVSLQVMDNVTLHLNGGVLHDRVLDDTFGTWGVATSIKTISGPMLVVEMFEDDRYEPVYGAGARFNIGSTRWTLDLGVARDTHVDETEYSIGVNIPSLF